MPDKQPGAEAGFKSMRTGFWQGVFVPAGTPRAVVNWLFDALQKMMAHSDVKKRLNDGGAEVVVSKSLDEFMMFVRDENERFGRATREAKITAD